MVRLQSTIFGLCLALLVALSPPARAAGEHTFNLPRWFDDRLDWCLTWASNCGKPAADNFCKRQRYTGATTFTSEPGVGKTRVSGTNQICNGKGCTGFKTITCYGHIPVERVFANPSLKGNRLDLCLTWAKDCGKPAADAFCRSKNLGPSIASVLDPERGRSETRLIGSNQVCTGKGCVGFQMITCEAR